MQNFIKYIVLLFLVVGCKSITVNSTTTFVGSTNKNINYEGRLAHNKKASEIYWSGTSIKINFEGTSVKAILDDENGNNYFNIIIDGTKFETLKLNKGKHTYILVSNLPIGKHSIELTKRNEWTYGKTLFYGFEIEGKLLDKDPEKELFFEFYGDSITAGHGNEDYSGNDKPDGNVTNNYNTYAAKTARAFNAEYSCIARGGIGIMVSWFNMIMPEMYYRLNPNNENSKWDFTQKTPDVVVVNLFQNDSWIVNRPKHEEFKRRFGTEKPSEEKIINAYANFLKSIRSKYPKTPIVCVLGNMDITKAGSKWPSYVESAVKSLNDNEIYTCFSAYKNSKGHPKVEEHQLIANKLIATIKNNIIN
ncbi:GDSL-like Lipase/Acylhydrolase family protein [Lutibacter oricola]|uniref:GDSL-like Lipase/Acylhydrolase family protein n=1 Tax=Lutibacter oricola TaxID=762486 RepID=A0A1H2ZLC1_9FLAO|nr:SGNH/GDSL hydrolase family protein [Lutibacter oricola]SDX18177.1 GDSL-like Lipase/Acylhydrolase family protein [Lutibacter oricola]